MKANESESQRQSEAMLAQIVCRESVVCIINVGEQVRTECRSLLPNVSLLPFNQITIKSVANQEDSERVCRLCAKYLVVISSKPYITVLLLYIMNENKFADFLTIKYSENDVEVVLVRVEPIQGKVKHNVWSESKKNLVRNNSFWRTERHN